jgi:hypothetical protein
LNEAAESTPSRKIRLTAQDRADRRMRIFARLQEGWSYEAIAQAENLTRERIRQIVAETLNKRAIDPSRDHTRLQIARLDPALRLAAQQVAAGELRAVDRLIRVLDRLDKYQGAGAMAGDARSDGDSYAKLMAKLGHLIERRNSALAAGASAPSGAGETSGGLPGEAAGRGEPENDVSKFFPRQVVENSRSGQE